MTTITRGISDIRAQFPLLQKQINDRELVYFDNAATTLKPERVVDRIAKNYRDETSNIHRGAHTLSEELTGMYEGGREHIARFINASSEREIIFTRGTTDSINTIAQSLGQGYLKAGDEVIVTEMEHHSNIVPWQLLRDRLGIVLKVIPMDDQGVLLLDELEALITEKTRLISMVHISNALGTVNPVRQVIQRARRDGILTLIDGAQSIAHVPVDVQALDCDFFVFSGHKMYGPTGIGVLYGKEAVLEKMPPVQGGGDMIMTVRFEASTWNRLPWKFEAGTPHIAGVIGLTEAVRFLQDLGMDHVKSYEDELARILSEKISALPFVRTIGEAPGKIAVASLVMEGAHAHDLGQVLDHYAVAIRTGHHCAMPVMEHFNIPATARASLAVYNTPEEIDRFCEALKGAHDIFDA
jgi:cysteine desulfurase/selenocysteine lyase